MARSRYRLLALNLSECPALHLSECYGHPPVSVLCAGLAVRRRGGEQAAWRAAKRRFAPRAAVDCGVGRRGVDR